MKHIIILAILFTFNSELLAQNPPPPGPPPIVPLTPPVDPVGNQSTLDKIMLGKVLFWDEQLSSTKTVACASCHILSSGGTDPRATAINIKALNPGADEIFQTDDDIIGSPGVPQSCDKGDYIYSEHYGYEDQTTGRKSISVINAGYAENLFWDGRADDRLIDPISNEVILTSGAALESQVLGPPTSSVEMAHNGRSWTDIIDTLESSSPLALSAIPTSEITDWVGSDSYFQLFDRVYGNTEINAAKIAMAIASYERSLFSNQTPYDDFIAGNNNALTQQERSGLNVFVQTGCVACHGGSMMTDNDFHNTGVTANDEDQGRFEVTGLNADRGRFKTPSLRHLENKSTFMHNGGFTTIEQVIDFYDRGGDVNNPNLDNRMIPLNLSIQQKNDLAAFLKRPLTDTRVVNETGPFSSPLLFAESDRVPVISGSGIAGTSAKTPIVTAIEPPLLGNKSFTIAVENTLVASNAYFIVNTIDPGTNQLPLEEDSLIFQTTTTKTNNINDGVASLSIELPNDMSLNETTLFGRWYIEDDQAINGHAISELVTFTLFKPDYGTAGKIFAGGFEEANSNCE